MLGTCNHAPQQKQTTSDEPVHAKRKEKKRHLDLACYGPSILSFCVCVQVIICTLPRYGTTCTCVYSCDLCIILTHLSLCSPERACHVFLYLPVRFGTITPLPTLALLARRPSKLSSPHAWLGPRASTRAPVRKTRRPSVAHSQRVYKPSDLFATFPCLPHSVEPQKPLLLEPSQAIHPKSPMDHIIFII